MRGEGLRGKEWVDREEVGRMDGICVDGLMGTDGWFFGVGMIIDGEYLRVFGWCVWADWEDRKLKSTRSRATKSTRPGVSCMCAATPR